MEIYLLLNFFFNFVIIRISQRNYLCFMQISKKTVCFASAQSEQRLSLFIYLKVSYLNFTSEDSIFWLVSVAEQAGLSLALSENPKADFAASWISFCAVCLCPQNDADQSFSIVIIIRFF